MNEYALPMADSVSDVLPMLALTLVVILWGFLTCSTVLLASRLLP